jgi:hypothetical protein
MQPWILAQGVKIPIRNRKRQIKKQKSLGPTWSKTAKFQIPLNDQPLPHPS